MLSVIEVVKVVEGNFIPNNLFISWNNWRWRLFVAGESPNILVSEEEEVGLAAVNHGVVGVVSVHYLIVAISKEEESNFAFWAITLCRTLHGINLTWECVELRVVDINQAIRTPGVTCLDAVTIFEQDALVTFLLVPHTQVLIKIKLWLGGHIRAPAPLPTCLHLIQ